MVAACGGTPTPNEATSTKNTPTEVAPRAVAVKQAHGIPMGSFDELEYLFHLDTDTTYIINFWATWCKPCVAELPYFEQLTAAYADQPVKVRLISLDFPKQIESRLLPFIEKNQLQSEVWVLDDPDANSWIDKVSPQWSGAIPATVVYRRDQRGFWEQSFESYEELNTIVKPFIKN